MVLLGPGSQGDTLGAGPQQDLSPQWRGVDRTHPNSVTGEKKNTSAPQSGKVSLGKHLALKHLTSFLSSCGVSKTFHRVLENIFFFNLYLTIYVRTTDNFMRCTNVMAKRRTLWKLAYESHKSFPYIS